LPSDQKIARVRKSSRKRI